MTEGELRQIIAFRASTDSGFRSSLLANPKATIDHMLKKPLPHYYKVRVLEEDETIMHVVIPEAACDELHDEALSTVAGGFFDAGGQNSYACFGTGLSITTKLELSL